MDAIEGYESLSSSSEKDTNRDNTNETVTTVAAGTAGGKDSSRSKKTRVAQKKKCKQEEPKKDPSATVDDEQRHQTPVPRVHRALALNAAPVPSHRFKFSASAANMQLQLHSQTQLQLNLKYQLPVQGPASDDPNGPPETSKGKVGRVETNTAFDEVAFDIQRKQFQKIGSALAPDDHGSLISTEKGHYRPVSNMYSHDGSLGQAKRQKILELNEQKPQLVEGSDDEAIYGVWGPPSAAEIAQQQESVTDIAAGRELQPEQLAERQFLEEKARRKGLLQTEEADKQQFDRMLERKMAHLLPPRLDGEEAKPMEASTKFHGADEYDYKGQSWMAPPSGIKPVKFGDVDDHRCYIPKKCIHRFTGRE